MIAMDDEGGGPGRDGAGPSDGTPLAGLDRAVFAIERAAAYLSAFFIFMLMLLGVYQIAARRLLDAPLLGYIDLVELSMTTFAFLAIAYTERLGGHVRMELMIGSLRGRTLWAAETVGVLVAMFVIGVLIYYGWTHAMRAYNFGDSTIDAQYPWWPSKMLVPIAFALLWVRLCLMLWGYLRLWRDPALAPVGVPTIADIRQQAEREAREAEAAPAPHGRADATPPAEGRAGTR